MPEISVIVGSTACSIAYQGKEYFIIGIEQDKPEDVTDLERYVKRPKKNSMWRLR
jgi:hypothetical protein